jgi:hypothetical protein
MAALTRLSARKASEIVMLTLRVLHPSRLAMRSALAVGFSSVDQLGPFGVA